jgi:hypothetical protein
MKYLSLSLIFLMLLQSCGNNKGSENCKDAFCQKKTSNANQTTVISDTTKDLSCKLTSTDLQKRKINVLSVLKNKILEKKELNDGYSFKFENSDEMIDLLTDFIKSERQCCDFFNFALSVRNDGFIWFDLTGPKDAKKMIGEELDL